MFSKELVNALNIKPNEVKGGEQRIENVLLKSIAFDNKLIKLLLFWRISLEYKSCELISRSLRHRIRRRLTKT